MSDESQDRESQDSQPQGSRLGARPAQQPARGSARLFRKRVALSPSEALHPEAAPPPPTATERRQRPALEAFSGFLTFLLFVALLAEIGIVYASHAVRQPGPLASDRAVLIAPGSDSEAIISQLQSEGVIDSAAPVRDRRCSSRARAKSSRPANICSSRTPRCRR